MGLDDTVGAGNVRSGSEAKAPAAFAYDSYGSGADIGSSIKHVRYGPEADIRQSGLKTKEAVN